MNAHHSFNEHIDAQRKLADLMNQFTFDEKRPDPES
jgi:hypothetical protein